MPGKNRPKILVVGSFMMDLVVRTPRAPEEGETIIGSNFSRFPGGKGANQAVAASRLGANVFMAGKLGEDDSGEKMLEALHRENVATEHVRRNKEAATGMGFVTLDQHGNNRIIVIPGANLCYDLDDLATLEELIPEMDIIMLQLEMDLNVVKEAAKMGAKHNVPVLLNPAPAQKLDDEFLEMVTYLTPNETESEILTGIPVIDLISAEKAAKKLVARGPKCVVITLAEKGAVLATKDTFIHVPGFPVTPVDTVAAGDAFNGAFALAIAQALPLKNVLRIANAVGALTVSREGAIPSLPTKEEVEAFMAKHSEPEGSCAR